MLLAFLAFAHRFDPKVLRRNPEDLRYFSARRIARWCGVCGRLRAGAGGHVAEADKRKRRATRHAAVSSLV